MTESARNLDRSLVEGIAWTGVVKWLTQLVSWTSTLVTVRLLAPTDYGLFGMAMVFVGFGQIVTEAGVTAAVVQRPTLSDEEKAQLAGVSVLLGVLLALLACGLAIPISSFYSERAVRGILIVLSSVFLLRSVQIVPRALLMRELQFRRLAVLDGVEAMTLVSTTLALAFTGRGYWALVLGTLASNAVALIIVLQWRWQRPAIPTDLVRQPLVFSWHVIASQVTWYAYANADFAVVGKVLGSTSLGAYTGAWNIASIPGDRVGGLVGRVMPPLFAAVQQDRAALRRYLGATTEAMALLTLPVCLGLSVLADEFVPTVMGHQWMTSVAPLRLLALYAACRSVLLICPSVLIATGRAQLNMRFNLLAAIVMPIAFYIGTGWGATGVAASWVIAYPVLALATYTRAALDVTQMSWYAYAKALWPATRAAAIMAAVVIVIRQITPPSWPVPFALGAHVAAGAITYLILIAFALSGRLRPILTLIRSSLLPEHKDSVLPVHAPGAAADHHRILLITYHFPPSDAVGALRWQKFVQLGAERGWQFDVIALDPAGLARQDRSRLEELPPGTRVYGVPATEPPSERVSRRISSVMKKLHLRRASAVRHESLSRSDMRWWPRSFRDVLRAYFAWRDSVVNARWARRAANLALSLHRPGVHHAVITCGPPHMVHVAGRSVTRWTGLPLVLDLRDPWSLVQRLPEATASRVGLTIATRRERKAMASASLVIVNTEPLRQAMSNAYPEKSKRIIAVTNGCDEECVAQKHADERFVLAYAGTIYLDRDPRPLFRAVERFTSSLGLAPSDFSIEFMGQVDRFDGVPLADIAEAEGVGPFVRLHATRPRHEALEFLSRAAMLVVLPQDSDLAIPAKVFDYLRYNAWLLALAEPSSATALLLNGTGADLVFPDDVDGISIVLRERYLEFRSGVRAPALASIPRLTRRHQAAVLFDAVESLTGPAMPAPEAELCVAS